MELTNKTKSMCWLLRGDFTDLSSGLSDYQAFTGLPELGWAGWLRQNWADALVKICPYYYAKVSLEKGANEGREHFHLAVSFTQQVSLGAIKRIFPQIHADKVKKIFFLNAAAYVGASPDFINREGKRKGGIVFSCYESGNLEDIPSQGERSDVVERDVALFRIKEVIDKGCRSMLPLFNLEFPTMCRMFKGVEFYMNLVREFEHKQESQT